MRDNRDPKLNYGWSSYSVFANNPILYHDPFGDTVQVSYNSNTLNYQGGKLFNRDGSEYTGKQKGFLKKSVEALNEIRSTSEGGAMLSELESSDNTFKIVKSSGDKFEESNRVKAYANAIATDPNAAFEYKYLQEKGIDLSGGSGGIIRFNPAGGQMYEQGGEYKGRPVIALAHELFHGLDANRGLLDARMHLGVKRSEWQAVYRENIMRQEMKLPLRTYYMGELNPDTRVRSPKGPSMLTPTGGAILPFWYKK